MKRHRSLHPLSSDHNAALQLAEGIKKDGPKGLRRALPAGSAERLRHVRRFIEEHLEPHFAAEEKIVFPAARGQDPDLDALIDRTLAEHADLRALFERLGSASLDERAQEEILDALGRALVDHVRMEERQLFVRIEQVLSERALDEIGERIAAARIS